MNRPKPTSKGELRCPLLIWYRLQRGMAPHDMPMPHRAVLGAICDRAELESPFPIDTAWLDRFLRAERAERTAMLEGVRIFGWISLPNIQNVGGVRSVTTAKEARAGLIDHEWLVQTAAGGGDDAGHYEVKFDGRLWLPGEAVVVRDRTPLSRRGGPPSDPTAERPSGGPPRDGGGSRPAMGGGVAQRSPGGPLSDPEDHYKDPRLGHRSEPRIDHPSPTPRARDEGQGKVVRGPWLDAVGQKLFAALEAPYGDPPSPVLRRIATNNLAHQLAQMSAEDGHTGTRFTDDLVLAIQEIAGHERALGEQGSNRTDRELTQRLVIACREIKRGAAAAARARVQENASPRREQRGPRSGPQPVRSCGRQWKVGGGGVR